MTKPAEPPKTARTVVDEPPPFWSRWGRIYVFVAALLLVETIVFWLVTRWAS